MKYVVKAIDLHRDDLVLAQYDVEADSAALAQEQGRILANLDGLEDSIIEATEA